MSDTRPLPQDRYFSPEPTRRDAARELYDTVKDLPLVAPHTHVDPRLLTTPEMMLGTPAELFVIPDHYVFRMLYSQGMPLEELGIPARGPNPDGRSLETDHRKIWQRFAENFHLFRGTPTSLWISDVLTSVFGIEEKLSGENAQRIYDRLDDLLARPEFSPRALFDSFGLETLCTTDGAADPLEHHRILAKSDLGGTVRPTFRPDNVANIDAATGAERWRAGIEQLAHASGAGIGDYRSFIMALESRRDVFRKLGAVATDHSAVSPRVERLPEGEAEAIFTRALTGRVTEDDAARFTAHMLWEMARMSSEDGLVMQLHAGSFRNHHQKLYERFGPDKGADVPVATEWTRNLAPVLNEYGSDPRFRLIVYTLDESAYSRELAPLAGHYPSLYLGAPWWFYDSPEGMRRYLDAVTETAGIYNLAGFNDDTRAFASISARHDMWRRITCDWLAGKVLSGIVEQEDAYEMAGELAYDLARRAYRLAEKTD